VISNVDAEPYRDTDTIRNRLVESIVSQVRWHDTAARLLTYDLDLVVEFGASGVLGPLMKRMPGAPEVNTVSDFNGVEKLRQKLAKAPA
jgi:malonyl CoA-acyl carrier protein transacylase